jgi:hypothetical protein
LKDQLWMQKSRNDYGKKDKNKEEVRKEKIRRKMRRRGKKLVWPNQYGITYRERKIHIEKIKN